MALAPAATGGREADSQMRAHRAAVAGGDLGDAAVVATGEVLAVGGVELIEEAAAAPRLVDADLAHDVIAALGLSASIRSNIGTRMGMKARHSGGITRA